MDLDSFKEYLLKTVDELPTYHNEVWMKTVNS